MTHARPLSAALGLSLGLALAVTATATAATPSASTPSPHPAYGRFWAIDTPVAAAEGRTPALRPSARAKALAASSTVRTEGGARTLSAASSGPARAAARAGAAATCNDLTIEVNQLNDSTYLNWKAGSGAATIARQREGGAWQTIGTAPATVGYFEDRTVNPDAAFIYRLTVGGLTCDVDADGYTLSMQTEDAHGYYDAVVGQSPVDPLLRQNPGSYGNDESTVVGGGADPTYSRDGRLVATMTYEPPTGPLLKAALRVWNVRTGQEYRVVQFPEGTVPGDFAFSPDGRQVALTEYTVTADGKSTSQGLYLLDLGTGAVSAVSGGSFLMQPDWIDASTLLAVHMDGSGLYRIPLAGPGAEQVPVNSFGAQNPEVGPDGSWYWAQTSPSVSLLRRMTPGRVTTLATSTTDVYAQPRTAPDGTLFYVVIHKQGTPTTDDDTFDIVTGESAPTATTLGVPYGVDKGFVGYDVRQPKSKGTSDFAGDAGNDLIAKNAAGQLYAYPSSPDALVSTRVSMGAGWNLYNQVVTAGDLNGDDRADILGRDAAGGLWFYAGQGNGKVSPRVKVGSGWSSYLLVAGGDYIGDDRADVLGRDAKGSLWVYPGDGTGHFGARSLITSGWSRFTAIIASGDLDYDNTADLLGRDSSGTMYLYPGNGHGGVTGRFSLGRGWNAFTAFAGTEFVGFTVGLFARRPDGSMAYYVSVGDGRLDGQHIRQAGRGWNGFQVSG